MSSNTPNRKQIRATWWDYARAGRYFVTICTRDRYPFFGEVRNGEMIRSEAGNLAHDLWLKIPSHQSRVELGDFIVMPNHIHGILTLLPIVLQPLLLAIEQRKIIQKMVDDGLLNLAHPNAALNSVLNSDGCDLNVGSCCDLNVGSRHASTLHLDRNTKRNIIFPIPELFNPAFQSGKASPIPHSLPAIIGGYKSAVSKELNRKKLPFAWQGKYHDRIIRNQKEFDRIARYIRKNPKNWRNDQLFND